MQLKEGTNISQAAACQINSICILPSETSVPLKVAATRKYCSNPQERIKPKVGGGGGGVYESLSRFLPYAFLDTFHSYENYLLIRKLN
jgi:hypothetical protein